MSATTKATPETTTETTIAKTKESKTNWLSKLCIGLVLVGLIIVMTVLSPKARDGSLIFLTWLNISNIMLQTSVATIIAVGATCVILTGGIDLSVGSIMAVSAVCMGKIIHLGLAWVGSDASPMMVELVIISGLLTSVLVGTLCGLINGFFVVRCKIPPFIATLGMMCVARGLALIIAGGKTLYRFPESARWLGNGKIGPIPVPVIIAFSVVLVLYYVLTQTRFGRHIYALGRNRKEARLSGIHTDWVEMRAYIICGALCGIGALILVGRLNVAQPTAGMSYELNAIAATVIGGASLFGGVGSILGTFAGALILGVLQNGLTLHDVSVYSQQLIIGLIIIAAVLLDQIRNGNVSLRYIAK